MFTFLKKLFGGKEISVIGVDIGSSAIKVVQIRKKRGRAILETYGALALGPYASVEVGRATNLPSEKIAEALTDLLREAKVSSNLAGVTLPFNSSLMSLVEMPDVDPRQLAQMIPIEARKYIPVPINEVTLDWSIIPKTESPAELRDTDKQRLKTVEVLLVAIHNDIITKYSDVVSRGRLDTSFFEIEIFSAMRAVAGQENRPFILLDVGAATTKLYILERGIIRKSHIINRGSQDITLAISQALNISVARAETLKRAGSGKEIDEKGLKDIVSLTMDFVFAEANRVLLDYQRHYNRTIEKVILIGGGSALIGFAELAQENFQTTVVLGDPFEKVETPAFLEGVLHKAGPEFAAALGAALRRLQELE